MITVVEIDPIVSIEFFELVESDEAIACQIRYTSKAEGRFNSHCNRPAKYRIQYRHCILITLFSCKECIAPEKDVQWFCRGCQQPMDGSPIIVGEI